MSDIWAGYTRVSRVGDRKETLISPDLQADRIRYYADGRAIKVELLEPELDQSGGKVDRPILSDAISGVEDGRYAGIIVAQLDRLSRMDIADALQTIRRIEAAGGQVIAVAENFDAGTPEGRMARNVLLALGEMQLDRYRRQFKDAKASAVRRGIWPTRNVPIGYERTRRKDGGDGLLHIDRAAARKVKRAFEARAGGGSWSHVADILGMGGTSASKVIRSRVYLGELRVGELVNEQAHEPIVSRDLWEAAQISHPRPARGIREQALLTGLIRCAGCRHAMTPDMSSSGRNYRCHARKAAGRCEEPAIVSQGLLDPYVEALSLVEIDRLAHSATKRTDEITELGAGLVEAEAELAAYQEAVRVADIGPEAFAAGMRSRTEAVQMARRELAKARMRGGPVALPGKLAETWPSLTIGERRQVLGGALGVVWVRKGRGPIGERVRVIAHGFEPGDLPASGRRTDSITPLNWIEDLEGEVGPPSLEHAP